MAVLCFGAARRQSLGAVHGLLTAVPSLVAERKLWACRLQWLWHAGQDQTPWHLGSSRDWTHLPCTGSRILYHWATREALKCLFLIGCKCFQDCSRLQNASVYKTFNCQIVLITKLFFFPSWLEYLGERVGFFFNFLFFFLNERFFKFYNVLQFSKVSHTWFHIIP